ncbi:hypothetical protein HDU86_001517 [Geranomyces michiganensis]|nr:hypothetical protein HDU86_001517 [Geranomyces michiganensis]
MSNNENSVLAPINANASVAKDNGTAMSKTDAILNLIAKLTAALAENTAALKTGLGATVSAIASNTSAITAGFTANTTAVITIAEGIDTLNVNTVALGTFQERVARALEDMGAREVRRTLVQVFTYEGIALMLVAEFLTNTRDTHFIHFRAKASCSVTNDLAQPFCYFVSKRLRKSPLSKWQATSSSTT